MFVNDSSLADPKVGRGIVFDTLDKRVDRIILHTVKLRRYDALR